MRRNAPKNTRRLRILAIILITVFIAYTIRMADIQLVNNQYYVAQATDINTRTTTLKAPRGEILDRYGRPFATTREGYNITLNKAYLPTANGEINDTLLAVTKLLEANGAAWVDNLPLTDTLPYAFDGTEEQITALRKRLGLNHYATAENCWDTMVDRYSLTEADLSYQRRIAGIRYSMEAADFSISNPFTLAEDVDSNVMSVVSESAFALKGVEITVVAIRQYVDYELAAHIIGMTGPIYAEDWEELKAKGYSYNDKVGKSGIEKAFEDRLKGTDGVVTYTIDSSGKIIKSEVTAEPQKGDAIFLSLDKDMQAAAINAFKKAENKLLSNPDTDSFSGGAAVAVEIATGQVLMSVSYPTYSFTQYREDYSSLVQNKNKPLFNRAFNGTYAPGSAFKPAVALAALETGNLTLAERLTCTGIYTYYKDYQPHCLHVHGGLNLTYALSRSCNSFFFEIGRRTGIDQLNAYCRSLGLGELTGIELSESRGVLAGKTYSESVNKVWNEGNVLAAAIGQSDNAVTPVQLASYVSTIANGGTRYSSTLINRITTADYATIKTSASPQVIGTVEVSADNLNAVKMGMLSVTSDDDGTGRTAFGDYPIKVGGKTGTAESVGGAHGIFIAFAPYDNPEIAVAVVLEHGNSSSTAAQVAREILDSYFFADNDAQDEIPSDTVLP